MLNPDHRASVPGSHHVSPANFWPETTAQLAFPDPLEILDSTLRKTYFTAGNTTSQAGFVRIAEALVELGVETTCLNVTFGGRTDPTPQDWELMTTVLGAGLPLTVNVWSEVLLSNGRDATAVDPIDALHRFLDAGVTMIAPGLLPATDAEAEARQADELSAFVAEADRLGVATTLTVAQAGVRDFDQLVRACRHAAGLGMSRLDLMDSTSSLSPEGMCDFDQLVRACRHAAGLGMSRLDLMDSTSSLSPDAMRAFVRRFRAGVGEDVHVTMHSHDEFGLATACALAAASVGAHPDVSVNGMSYRCGFAPLEEVVLALEVLHGVDTGLRLDRLAHVSEVVARESGIEVPPRKPLTGSYAHLKHMPADVAAAIRTGQDAFPPVSHGLVPARMGARVSWVWGRFSSDDQTRALAESCGLDLSDDELVEVRRRLDEGVAAKRVYPKWLEPAEAEALMREAVAELRGGRADS